MTVGWLFDADLLDASQHDLAAAVKRQGHTVFSVNAPSPPYLWSDAGSKYRNAYPAGSCVITYADIDLVTRVIDDNIWTPGAFATVSRYFCSHYYAHLGRFLLNRDYIMLPFGELPRCREFLFDALGRDDRLFVRPDSPLKIFTGQTIAHSTFDEDYEFIGFYEFPTESLVVVSSPKTITTEWRFVVVEGEIITGSQYMDDGTEVSQPATDPAAMEFARSVVATGYQPDPVWVLDICRTSDGGYYLLETGGFSFASLYGCDKDAVVRAVSAVAKSIHASRSV